MDEDAPIKPHRRRVAPCKRPGKTKLRRRVVVPVDPDTVKEEEEPKKKKREADEGPARPAGGDQPWRNSISCSWGMTCYAVTTMICWMRQAVSPSSRSSKNESQDVPVRDRAALARSAQKET